MALNARLSNVVLDCPDPRALAGFYSEVTGWPVVESEDDWASLRDGDSFELAFQRAPDHQAPRWPDPGSSMQYHLDFHIEDIESAEKQVLALGATRFEHQPGQTFRVFADPAGHPFCLCW